MHARRQHAALFLLLFTLLGMACQGPPDSRLLHAREAKEWRAWEANLDMLYRARRIMRQRILLPDRPELGNEIEAAAWELALASQENNLAYMIQQETMNDLEHCQQAVQLAEEQIEPAKVRSREAIEALGPAMRRLEQALSRGDVERNRRTLRRFVAQMPENHHFTLLLAVDEEHRE